MIRSPTTYSERRNGFALKKKQLEQTAIEKPKSLQLPLYRQRSMVVYSFTMGH